MLERILWPAGLAAGSLAILLLVRWVSLRVLRNVLERRRSRVLEATIRNLRVPTLIWCLILAMHLGAGVSALPEKFEQQVFLWLQVFLILSVSSALGNVASAVIRVLLDNVGSAIARSGLLQVVLRIIAILIGGLIALSRLGLHIGPLLTALGVGGLAVSLALQDTLSNIFSGMGLLIEQAIRVGDRIRLESGQEGEILDIGWRTTRLRIEPNDMLVIPNIKLAQAITLKRGARQAP